VTASRPDVMFSVCMCARFQASLRGSHLKAIKRILWYLKHTPNVGLWYPKGAKFELVGYSNSDYAGCKVERKSTTGTCQLLGRSLVSWSSKKQNSIALSTVDAEYYGGINPRYHKMVHGPHHLRWSGHPARKIKAYITRLQVVLDIVIVPNRLFCL
jgi:hypothetical protein